MYEVDISDSDLRITLYVEGISNRLWERYQSCMALCFRRQMKRQVTRSSSAASSSSATPSSSTVLTIPSLRPPTSQATRRRMLPSFSFLGAESSWFLAQYLGPELAKSDRLRVFASSQSSASFKLELLTFYWQAKLSNCTLLKQGKHTAGG